MPPERLALGHTPTPLWRNAALDRLLGCEVWVKRDDSIAGAEAGNKIRKLEYLLADARARSMTAVITCGGVQSNHARATALLCRQLGMAPYLLLRVADPKLAEPVQGNLLLDRLAGAHIEFVTADQYRARSELMASKAQLLKTQGIAAYVIPEGGSNGLGALGYVEAMREVHAQLAASADVIPFDTVVHACGSGGTAAGVALGSSSFGVASQVDAIAVCDSESYFNAVITKLVAEARALAGLGAPAPCKVHDAFIGPGYGRMNSEQWRFLRLVTERTGLVLDPVYSGKALFGLANLSPKPRRALFLHTGGLPGLFAQAEHAIQ